jgi:Amt family ammonium transporter
MGFEIVSGFLLPAGVWLIVSAGVPLQAQRRLASATLIALALSLLCFVGFGFALMFGGIGAVNPAFAPALNAPVAFAGAQDIWIFAGAAGFLLDITAQPAVLALFVQALPLVLTCAVLLSGALAQRARTLIQIMLILVTCGIALPLAGCWLWAGGWLSALGATDAGRLAVIGLVAGSAGLAWLNATPHRVPAPESELPAAHLPARAVVGVLLVLAGMAGVLVAFDPDAALRQFLNSGIAVATALIVAGAYTAFTTRNADPLSASRAMLAAVFLSSAGAAWLPSWLMALAGAGCGLLATLGFYWVNETRRLQDESAVVTAVLLPSIAGMLIAGVFAGAAPLVASLIAVIAITLLAYAAARLPLWLAQFLKWPVLAAPPQVVQSTIPSQPATQPAAAQPAEAPATLPVEQQPAVLVDLPEGPAAQQIIDAHPATPDGRNTTPAAEKPSPRPRGLLGWLRRSTTTQPSPHQPKKVAYPYRFGGRRMASRPVAGEGSHVDGASSVDAS